MRMYLDLALSTIAYGQLSNSSIGGWIPPGMMAIPENTGVQRCVLPGRSTGSSHRQDRAPKCFTRSATHRGKFAE
ncbi:hypothetical protein HBH56_062370 [Parastagonospora nodorum]|nr:hypothetical protein HBH56_062370 [Parastagonospora nodorum]KAH3930791.1 hypothetical protein HBH54_106310 [Parastagonospora nodorum]KAH3954074.1 hypothetical protein HBH53_021250 [Parastagonospora nodorum]KAH4009961.1 hypothetical protein HBI13_212360 [Parastagonospora nodorum]KAH4207061.1 hypothetical protein HBI95_111850 [Parastagonospora nodorum]